MKRFLALFPYCVLLFALVLLYRELRDVNWIDFWREAVSLPPEQIVLASIAVVVNFFVMSLYDVVSLYQLGERLPYPHVLRTSFHAFAISNLVGHSLLTGLAIRVREYKNVSLSKMTQLMVMNLESWWIGFIFLCGVVLVQSPAEEILSYSHYLSKGLGSGLLVVVAVYLGLCWRLSGRTLQIRRFHIFLPSLKTGFMKVAVGAADTLVMSLTLYLLLPQALNMEFSKFFSVHLTAHFLGVVTMVPGGLGVLESVLIRLMGGLESRPALLASILLFRILHFLVPAGLTLLAEVLRRRRS